jgi:predicted porin
MKKHCIGLIFLSAYAGWAQAQSSVQIYGILDTGVAYIDRVANPGTNNPSATGSKWTEESGTVQQSRLGFKGSEDLGGGLKAFYNLEGGIAINTGASGQGGLIFGRTSIVGVSGDFGSLQFGRRKDYTDDVSSRFSSVDDYGTFGNSVHDNNLDRYGGNRSNNQIRYDSPDWNGLRLNGMYAFGETPSSLSTGQSTGLGASYQGGAFSMAFAYFQARLGTLAGGVNTSSDQGAGSAAACAPSVGTPGSTCLKTWILGAAYDFGKLRWRASVSQVLQPLATANATPLNFSAKFAPATGASGFTAGGMNNDKTTILDTGLDYHLTQNWTLNSSFLASRYHFVGAGTQGQLTEWIVGADYRFSRRTDLYLFAASLRASDMYNPGIIEGVAGADNSVHAITLGIRHLF